MPSDETLSGERIKHLELIQAIVTRLSTNSFLIKGWAITVAGAFYAYVATHLSWRVATVSFVPMIAFWCLDAYFLRLERLFRCLYDDVRIADHATEPFSMSIRDYYSRWTWLASFSSTTLVLLYVPILFVGFILLVASLV